MQEEKYEEAIDFFIRICKITRKMVILCLGLLIFDFCKRILDSF